MITSQVYDEISAGILENTKLKQIDLLISKGVFELCSLSNRERPLYLELIGHLGKGEASCIAFAKKRSAIVVTDDRAARNKCSQMGVLYTGTIGILKASMLDGLIDNTLADEILAKMVELGFYSPVRSINDIS